VYAVVVDTDKLNAFVDQCLGEGPSALCRSRMTGGSAGRLKLMPDVPKSGGRIRGGGHRLGTISKAKEMGAKEMGGNQHALFARMRVTYIIRSAFSATFTGRHAPSDNVCPTLYLR